MEIKVKKLSETATTPTKADPEAAGYDLYADIEHGVIAISGGHTAFINTGIAIEIPKGYWGGIYSRSGMACKQGLRPANCVGVIDSSYRGEVKVALHNDNKGLFHDKINERFVQHGDRIAQLIIHKCEDFTFVEEDELSNTERGSGGFGSSGR